MMPCKEAATPRFYRLHDALHDDAYQNTPPGTLSRKFGITWFDLGPLWCECCVILAKTELANRWPDVARDIAEAALACDRRARELVSKINGADGAANAGVVLKQLS